MKYIRGKYLKVLMDQSRSNGWRWGLHQGANYFKILLSAIMGKTLTGPISTVIMLTYRCNHRCSMCDFPGRFNPDLPEMDTQEIKALLSEIALLSGSGVSFYGGEPLLREDLVELVSFARDLGLTIHIASNGFLLTEEIARKLIEAGTNLFTISLDGATPEVHDQQRGVPGAYQKAIDAIRNIRKVRTQLNAPTRLAVATTFTPHNIHELEPLVKLILNLGADSFTVCEVQSMATLPNQFSVEDIINLRLANEKLCRLKHKYPKFIDNSQAYIDIVRKLLSGQEVRLKCFAPYTDLFIDPYGYVFPCNYFLGMNQPKGRIKPGKIAQFWYSPKYQKIRDQLSDCGRCNYLCNRELSLIFNYAWPFPKPLIIPPVPRKETVKR